ncbi:hypothetical protein D0C36_22470 [Mucilaginibacter conchicola]|uniref:Uncharacterized protein n=1 Tax=Mucilaginibacter conchicola TaxID=2303333 RepID=A0A372NPJ8_9SPHI|nr:hypothetical protein [Mucilaginibacter conchicola]RFZ90547.1 hypothetical protein D0C36_22470 [Mucilaginibacter conchicola]
MIQSNQKSYSKEASLPHKAFSLQAVRTTGGNILPPLCSHTANASASIAMPLLTHYPPLFYPLSPEAFLLTGKR